MQNQSSAMQQLLPPYNRERLFWFCLLIECNLLDTFIVKRAVAGVEVAREC